MQKRRLLSYVICLFLGLPIAVFFYFATGPDLNLCLIREVPSELSPDRMDRNISSVTRWPQWFFSLANVQLEYPGAPLEKGAILILKIDPKKGEYKRFDLKAQVLDYSPGNQLSLKILDDSTGRLVRIFDQLTWKIEFIPRKKGSLIRGTVTAHTHHWRSRVFGRLAEKILLNQVFYPNLLKLSELKQPFSMDLSPQIGPETAR